MCSYHTLEHNLAVTFSVNVEVWRCSCPLTLQTGTLNLMSEHIFDETVGPGPALSMPSQISLYSAVLPAIFCVVDGAYDSIG